MAGMHGSFLVKDHENYVKYNALFIRRVNALHEISSSILTVLVNKYPNLKNCINVSYPNIFVATVRYFNDLLALKTMHNIDRLNHSKKISYTAKSLSNCPAIIFHCEKDEYFSLTDEERQAGFNANYLVIQFIVEYFFKDLPLVADRAKIALVKDKIVFLLKTNTFDEHSVSHLLPIIAD